MKIHYPLLVVSPCQGPTWIILPCHIDQFLLTTSRHEFYFLACVPPPRLFAFSATAPSPLPFQRRSGSRQRARGRIFPDKGSTVAVLLFHHFSFWYLFCFSKLFHARRSEHDPTEVRFYEPLCMSIPSASRIRSPGQINVPLRRIHLPMSPKCERDAREQAIR
jgi:hypothetical protein